MIKAIKAENISKAYQIGEFSTGTITSDIHRWWTIKRGKEDPYLKVGEANDRTQKGASNIVWSLRDINFEIEQGEAVGIIGRNGAGKSTLLKILSRVTTPTSGEINVKGRIASLLEVGTGFHPELTGRENIYLNGAILGMRKKEITRKFDEIVDFAGIERYIDTPVKRYSSGMYVRLAFAVAAHLESEILIVDEVLAVGDAEFQKKCLGKMNDVSRGEGRTVLFVSHNMASIINLCTTGILLHQGKVIKSGTVRDVVDKYILNETTTLGTKLHKDLIFTTENKNFRINSVSLSGSHGISNQFSLSEEINCDIEFEIMEAPSRAVVSIQLLDKYGECIFSSLNSDSANLALDPLYNKTLLEGKYKTRCTIPSNFLNESSYKINVVLSGDETFKHTTFAEHAIDFHTHDTGETRKEFKGHWIGTIRPKLLWGSEAK